MHNTPAKTCPIQLKPLSSFENAARRAGALTAGAVTGLGAYFAADALERGVQAPGASGQAPAGARTTGAGSLVAPRNAGAPPAMPYSQALALPGTVSQFVSDNRFLLAAGTGVLCAVLTYRWVARAVNYLQNRKHLAAYREDIVDGFRNMTPAQLKQQLNDATLQRQQFAFGTENYTDLSRTRETLMAALQNARLRGVEGAYL